MANKIPRHWVLLRGLVREQAHWGEFPSELQRCFPDSTVHLLDLPGNGELHHLPSFATIRDAARWVHGETLPWQDSLGVIAISLGGMVACEWAQVFKNINCLVMINSSFKGVSPFWERLRPRNYWRLMKLPFCNVLTRERVILQMTTHLQSSLEERAQKWAQVAEQHPVSVLNALRQLKSAASYRVPQAPSCPALILTSEQDQLVSTHCSQSLSKLWKLPIRCHNGAGHDLPLDDGPWVAGQIRSWLLASDLE